MNIFEFATRSKLRFPSTRGDLTTEQLWDLPLQSRDGFDLDTVAKTVHRTLKGMDEESFVKSKPATLVTRLDAKMEVVKHIISYKLAQQEAATKRAARNEKREKLISALADKENEALKGLTPEQIREQLRELDEQAEA